MLKLKRPIILLQVNNIFMLSMANELNTKIVAIFQKFLSLTMFWCWKRISNARTWIFLSAWVDRTISGLKCYWKYMVIYYEKTWGTHTQNKFQQWPVPRIFRIWQTIPLIIMLYLWLCIMTFNKVQVVTSKIVRSPPWLGYGISVSQMTTDMIHFQKPKMAEGQTLQWLKDKSTKGQATIYKAYI
jgi:hypothetical protein